MDKDSEALHHFWALNRPTPFTPAEVRETPHVQPLQDQLAIPPRFHEDTEEQMWIASLGPHEMFFASLATAKEVMPLFFPNSATAWDEVEEDGRRMGALLARWSTSLYSLVTQAENWADTGWRLWREH